MDLDVLARALDWPFGYLIAVAQDGTPPTVHQTGPESTQARGQGASVPLTAPFAALLGLVDFGHDISLQAETNAMAVRLAREMSQGMTQTQRISS